MSTELLAIEELQAFYGKSHILQGVTLAVKPGEAVGLLGRNGVGKTTTLKAIMGLIVRRGTIRFSGRSCSRAETSRRITGTFCTTRSSSA